MVMDVGLILEFALVKSWGGRTDTWLVILSQKMEIIPK